MDVVSTMIEMTQAARNFELTPIKFRSGCQRVLFRAETDADASNVVETGGFCYDTAGAQMHSSMAVTSFVTTVEEAIRCARNANNGRHFFICDLPDQYVEACLDVRDPEQHVRSTLVDTLFQVVSSTSSSNRFVKAIPMGTQWQPRLLLLAKHKGPDIFGSSLKSSPSAYSINS